MIFMNEIGDFIWFEILETLKNALKQNVPENNGDLTLNNFT